MTRIFKRSDRIKLKLDDVTVIIGPLSLHQKAEVQSFSVQAHAKTNLQMMQEGLVLLLKYGIKQITGLKNYDGTDYVPRFEDGLLSDETIEDLFNIELHQTLIAVCTKLINGIPDEFVDESGKKIEGVEIISSLPGDSSDPKP